MSPANPGRWRPGLGAPRRTPIIDLHAHPGAFHRPRTGELPLSALDDMQAGGVDAAFFAGPPP